jgi:hypothetical protein
MMMEGGARWGYDPVWVKDHHEEEICEVDGENDPEVHVKS